MADSDSSKYMAEVSVKRHIGSVQCLTVVISPTFAKESNYDHGQHVTVKSKNLEFGAVVCVDKKCKCRYTLLNNGCIPEELNGTKFTLSKGYPCLFAENVTFTFVKGANKSIQNNSSTEVVKVTSLENVDLKNLIKFLKFKLNFNNNHGNPLPVQLGMLFSVQFLTQQFFFIVTDIDCFYDNSIKCRTDVMYQCFGPTVIEIKELNEDVESSKPALGFSSFGGYEKEIEDLKSHLDQFFSDASHKTTGILISGSSGVGKSLIGNILEIVYKEKCLKYSPEDILSSFKREAELNLKNIFQKTRARSPAVIFIDDIDEISASRDEGGNTGIVTTLLNLMDGVNESRSSAVLVIATASRPENLDAALRRPGRISHDISLSIPSEGDRLSILKILLDSIPPESVPSDLVAILASKTPGYTAGDLVSVVTEAFSKMEGEEEYPCNERFIKALDAVKPSSLKNIKFQNYKISLEDIYGYENLKSFLVQCFEVTLNKRKLFDEAGIAAPSRYLLLGPPGCGKSMLVNALANHFNLTIIPVRRSDVFGKYFGESEKNLALLFEKARKSSPCILHFTNFDGLVGRKQNAETNSDVETRIINYLKVMFDGVVENENFFVVAETNRPDLLDKNVIRYGRFHQYLYFRLPSVEDRKIMIENSFKCSLEDAETLEVLLKGSEGYSMSEIKVLCDEVKRLTEKSLRVLPESIEEAFENVLPNVSARMMSKYKKFFDIHCTKFEASIN